MTFADIQAGVAVFLDANTLVYHFTNDPTLGDPCTKLLERIENQEIMGYCSPNVLGELSHRLMTIEANVKYGWPFQGIAGRLKNHPAEVSQLTKHRSAIDELPLFGVRLLDLTGSLVSKAADVSIQTGLLTGDALVVAVMQQHGLAHLASHDSDFDRVPGITRYAPV
jgi:predicted nucleic acid-binding protein